jgi:hypothetical protein
MHAKGMCHLLEDNPCISIAQGRFPRWGTLCQNAILPGEYMDLGCS